jgi:polysaccharide export outer membrane protein
MNPSNILTSYYSKLFCVGLFFIIILTSCGVTKNPDYLKNLDKDTSLAKLSYPQNENKIQTGDQLSIVASSLSPEEDILFNNAAAISDSKLESGFRVLPDGTVLLHRLGKVHVEGLTRRQLATQLENDLLPYLKDPVVHVSFLNYKVTVMGAVGISTIIPIPEERLSIFEVLIKSGGISENGMKDKVMIIRDSSQSRKVKIVDLQDHNILNSPWYFVQQNDIVIVKNDLEKIKREKIKTGILSSVGIVASILSLFIVVLSLIKK